LAQESSHGISAVVGCLFCSVQLMQMTCKTFFNMTTIFYTYFNNKKITICK